MNGTTNLTLENILKSLEYMTNWMFKVNSRLDSIEERLSNLEKNRSEVLNG